jgi:hypothetical protein
MSPVMVFNARDVNDPYSFVALFRSSKKLYEVIGHRYHYFLEIKAITLLVFLRTEAELLHGFFKIFNLFVYLRRIIFVAGVITVLVLGSELIERVRVRLDNPNCGCLSDLAHVEEVFLSKKIVQECALSRIGIT